VILAFVEHADGRPDRLSLEALTVARRLGTTTGQPLRAVLFGSGARDAATQLANQGVATASLVDDDRLAAYAPAAWGSALAQLAAHDASAVVAAGSERGNEVMAHVGARTGDPVAANCTEVTPGTPWTVVRQRWAGSLLEEARLDGGTPLLTIAAHALPVEEVAGTAPAIETFKPEVTEADLRARLVGREAPVAGSLNLADAKVVVGGGRGVGGPDGFGPLEELASLLGAAVGVSRVATSAGWRPHSMQIGQTGLRIAPDLYIACGISGAIQHIVGCRAAKRILVINKDPDAPIMSRASYAVIGDLHAVVPAISAEIRRVRGNGASAG
jgi:electron transfer flavoprotein alpha subunit